MHGVPCHVFWGSLARRVNIVQGGEGAYTAMSEELWDILESLLPNSYFPISETILLNGDVVFEWPQTNYGYNLHAIQELLCGHPLTHVDV